jgi:hypothetical protein
MKGLAEKALKAWDEEEDMGEEFPMDSESEDKEDYSGDLEAEMTALASAMAKKDAAGMAEAFKAAMALCK